MRDPVLDLIHLTQIFLQFLPNCLPYGTVGRLCFGIIFDSPDSTPVQKNSKIKHYILQFLLMVCFGAKIDAEGVIGSTKSIRSNKTRNRGYWI